MFRLACDNDSHWYVIPVDKSADWNAWTELDQDDEAAWEAPEYAVALHGSPCHIDFPSWVQR